MSDDTNLAEVIGTRFANNFYRLGVYTVGDLKTAIENYKLTGSERSGYIFYEDGIPFPRNTGPKCWQAVTDYLSGISFDWEQYVVNYVFNSPKTLIEYEAVINRKIDDLAGLISEYKELRQK